MGGNKSALISRLLEHYTAKARAGGGLTTPNRREKARLPDKGTYPTPLAAQLGANLQRELREALDDRGFLEDGGLVGVPCMHLYEQVGWCLRGGTRACVRFLLFAFTHLSQPTGERKDKLCIVARRSS